jgi:hypothetical protein
MARIGGKKLTKAAPRRARAAAKAATGGRLGGKLKALDFRAEVSEIGAEARRIATNTLSDLQRREREVEKKAAHVVRSLLSELRTGIHTQVRALEKRITELEKQAARIERR